MRPLRFPRCAIPALAVLALAASITAAWAAERTTIAEWPRWSRLDLKASAGLFLSGRVEMQLHRAKKGDVFETSTRAKFLGATIARTSTRTELDADGRPRRYLSLSAKRGRLYEFDDDGYVVSFLSPDNGPDAPIDQWTVKGTREFDFPRDENGKIIPVYDYYGMILRLADLPLQQVGDQYTLYVATSDGPELYILRVGETRQVERPFKDLSTGEKLAAPVTELLLWIIPVDPEEDQGFLGMKGETELWVERDSKTFVQIRGRVPRAGKVNIELVGLERAASGKGEGSAGAPPR